MKGSRPATPIGHIRLIGLLAIALISGCQQYSRDGEKVDFGPRVDVQDITLSVAKMVRDSDPSQTKIGAFGRFFGIDDIGAGALMMISTNTSHEITDRVAEAGLVTYTILERTIEYRPNSPESEKMSRSFQLPMRVSSSRNPTGPTPENSPLLSSAERFIRAQSLEPSVQNYLKSLGRVSSSQESAAATFHGLRYWEDTAPAPAPVRTQPNCLNLPDCRLRLRHVAFNIVSWEIPEGNLIHIELTTSPDIPQTIGFNMNPIWNYIPGLMRSCITRMVPIGSNGDNRTLLSQCKQVVNFAYDFSTILEDQTL